MAQTTVSTTSVTAGVDTGQDYRRPLAMVTTLFFMWGFLTSLNDILIPHLKSVFDLNYTKAFLIQFAFFTSYFVFSLPSGKLIDAVGYKKAMVAGLFTMGLGAFLFIPAASVPSYPLFLGALIVLAAGMTILQVSANPYVAILGPEKTAASRLNLAQAFNSLGTTIGPKLGGLLILEQCATGRRSHAPDVRTGSACISCPGSVFGESALSGVRSGADDARRRHRAVKLPRIASVEQRDAAHDSIWRHSHLILGAVGIFVYVGAEVSIGSFLVNYFADPHIGNISEKVASGFVSFYWGGAMVGRFIGSALQQKISPNKILGVAALDGRRAGCRVYADARTRRDVDNHRRRLVQLCHVPDNFHPGHRRPWTAYGRRLRPARGRYRRRRDHPRNSGSHRRPHRHPSRFLSADPMLFLYRVLCVRWLSTKNGRANGLVGFGVRGRSRESRVVPRDRGPFSLLNGSGRRKRRDLPSARPYIVTWRFFRRRSVDPASVGPSPHPSGRRGS